MLPRAMVRLDGRRGTPALAIWSQAALSVALLYVLNEFTDLTNWVIFAALIFYGLTVGAVIVLRRRLPDAPRPFRCPASPIVPLTQSRSPGRA